MRILKARAIVSGLVQGVGYRAWTEKTAKSLSLCGWVRNLPDGSVEAVFEGDENVVKEMLSILRQGPKFSKVSGVEASSSEDLEGFKEFQIRK